MDELEFVFRSEGTKDTLVTTYTNVHIWHHRNVVEYDT